MNDASYSRFMSAMLGYSRTLSTGEVNVDASPAKASRAKNGSDSVERLRSATDYLSRVSLRRISTPSVYLSVADRTNTFVTGCPAELRSWDCIHPPYLAKSKVPDDRGAFSAKIVGLREFNEIEAAVAAFLWHIDLHGHHYADGCGRTAILLAQALVSEYGFDLSRINRRAVLRCAVQSEPERALEGYIRQVLV